MLFLYMMKASCGLRSSDWISAVCSSDLDIALTAPFGEVRLQEILHAGVLGLSVMTIAQRVRFTGAGPADGVVIVDGARGDRHHRPPLVRPQPDRKRVV